MSPDYAVFATSEDDAAERFAEFGDSDPLPLVPPSLLNSADIYDYVRLTGMLHPFNPGTLKSGSYEAAIMGRCISWDAAGRRNEIVLAGDQSFTLGPNSIAFVEVAPTFRLPSYIAVRFNLKITHVHRGLLLGTGPLVDPGFVGKLLIPLHNLTTNSYVFRAGEGLIWIEFTKMSPNVRWRHHYWNAHTTVGQYVPFPVDKRNLQPEDYFQKASGNNPIRSSIPAAIEEGRVAARAAEQSARAAQRRAASAQRIVAGLGLLAAIGLVVALAGVTYQTWNLIQDTWSIATAARDSARQLEENVRQQAERIKAVELAQRQRATSQPKVPPVQTPLK